MKIRSSRSLSISMALSERQRVILALSRTVSGSLSVIASSIIIYKIFLRYRQQRCANRSSSNNIECVTTYHRMLLCVSVLDILTSFWQALSTLPVPASTGVAFGHGTTATCSAQGFFVQLSAATPVYMAALNIYFMLKIRYNVSDSVLSKRYEPWLHAVPLSFAFISASLGTALDIFNPIALPELGCWIAAFPRGCTIHGGCTRGYKIEKYIDLYPWLFSYGWLFASFLTVLVNSLLIYCSVRKQELRNARYLGAQLQCSKLVSAAGGPATSQTLSVQSNEKIDAISQKSSPFDADGQSTSQTLSIQSTEKIDATSQKYSPFNADAPVTNAVRSSTAPDSPCGESALQKSLASSASIRRRPNRKIPRSSRVAAVQSILYVSTAFFTTVWVFMPWVGYKLRVSTEWRFFFAFMVNIVNPFQGVFNLFIFVRLQYHRLRVTETDWSRLQCVKFCLFSPDTK